MKLFWVAFAIFILNLPFGYWRANVKKFSLQWALAVHIPVPFVITLRIFSGLGFQLISYPILVGAFFTGQYLSGMLNRNWENFAKTPVSSCLVWNLVQEFQLFSRRQG